MARSYWLVNSNRSRVKDLSKIQIMKINFFKYMFIYSGKINFYMGQRTTCHDNKKRIKEGYTLRRIEKINCSGLQKNLGRLEKEKRANADP